MAQASLCAARLVLRQPSPHTGDPSGCKEIWSVVKNLYWAIQDPPPNVSAKYSQRLLGKVATKLVTLLPKSLLEFYVLPLHVRLAGGPSGHGIGAAPGAASGYMTPPATPRQHA
ncbi:hypothetical protein B0T26DRAFT_731183 [Lasiosphaeria miniovina]|uniref:Uncharacterized protein n=1 Tax=Lasiosphaeria miniovina TaxID=1954250 RepID=A0AA39ZTU2_9PEZI|nr:uncharacterized protein B0T26DRAFT_731183 [Lasiosphaeria miniovina]KAK0703405.1 hypothetical protein B0T26DRAFT_731183 [Lasiosphaeria miniovina]